MSFRFLLGIVILGVVVMVACAGCSDRQRVNCMHIRNKALEVQNTTQMGGGRCD